MIGTIFDRFTQVMESDSRSKGGSGLGLAICKALVELHGGTISAASQNGEGTTFTFTVPTR
jgi:signal transduction histidine kinase